ncbi:MAG TPA: patatin-like phospholipase family protein [Kofleriaceae bacterium]
MLDTKPVFAILSIDGGGIRGIIPASVLVAFEKYFEMPVSQLFDLIVGTSTGGIISLALTCSKDGTSPAFTAQQVLDLYNNQDNDAQIFDPTLPWIHPFSPRGTPPPIENALLNAKYKASGVQGFLQAQFGSATLGKAIAPVACVSYRMDGTPQPWFFRSWAATETGGDFALVDVGRATGAAPIYFPPVTISSTDSQLTGTFADGGVCANDPALVALSQAASLLQSRGDSLWNYQVWLVSIGTGEPALTVQPSDGGVYGWFNSGNLLSVLMDGPMQITDGAAGMLLDGGGYTYARIQPPLTGPGYSCSPALDDYTTDNLANLLRAGQAAVGSDAFARAREALAGRRAARR